MPAASRADAVAGSLFGLAYGDALGAPTEFLTMAEIIHRYGAAGPRDLAGAPAVAAAAHATAGRGR